MIPYGIYDLAANTGWVNVGTDHDTARSRWNRSAAGGTPGPRGLPGGAAALVTADAAGSNGYRTRACKPGWRTWPQRPGCRSPAAISRPALQWNKVEHRLFSQITMNWRGRPLTSHAVVLNSIAATTTATGLTVTAELDGGRYPPRTKVSDEQMTELEEPP